MTAAALALVAAGLVLLLVEPALALIPLAGLGASTLLQPRARAVLAAGVALGGLAILAVGVADAGPFVTAAGAVVALAGAAAAWRSTGWPAGRTPEARGTAPAPDRQQTARDVWEALDRGEDPTR